MEPSPLTIDIITLFPSFFDSPLSESIVKIAQEKRAVDITVHNLRDYTTDAHKTCDDKPFGGGPGMVMKPEPIFECLDDLKAKRPGSKLIYVTPQGAPLTQQKLQELAAGDGFMILCGHYEGVDERVREALVDEEISIGDYVLTGGEIPAMTIVDGVVRLLPDVLGNEDSLVHESFQNDQLDHPHYTRPREYRGMKVPEVLVGGDHKKVEAWRAEERRKNTELRRKDILK